MQAAGQPEPIAVVGSGCRFAGGANSPSALWKLLVKPRDVSSEIADERFQLKGYYHPDGSHHGTTNVQRAYMLSEDFRAFDAGFFNISANEADSMDPQQRQLMEVVYEALEAGGHSLERLRGSDTGVFVGTMSVDYNDVVMRDVDSTPRYFATGTSRAILANRVSYFFDWHGPSMTIDTACSSSMVALHQSVAALRAGEARVAVAGGTELLLGPEQFVGSSKMKLLSPTGRSRMWDAKADGYARGDGIAALVLKKLCDAEADGDAIECIIRETGVNQDGRSTGLTVPSSEAQAKLIRGTYARAALDVSDARDRPQFFEAHGTGTSAGDPREAAAIDQCFPGPPLLYVGSIKTIIGHTEGTAGLAGVLKASLALRHAIVPPNLLLTRLNPDVAQHCRHLHVPTAAATPWPALPQGVPRRVSVNSFGFGGTNGHAIVESYQATASSNPSNTSSIPFTPFAFSAASPESLKALLQSYSAFLKSHGAAIDLCDLAWTLHARRSALPYKAALSATSVDRLTAKLDAAVEQAASPVRSAPQAPRILAIFTGQGAQWPTMGAQLIKASPAVRHRLSQLDESLATLPVEADRPGWRIADELSADGASSRLNEAALSQPLCTALQVVLVDLLRCAGIEFAAVVGHSSGEIAACYAAGLMDARDAVRIAYYRGLHARRAQGREGQKGAMLAAGTGWDDARSLVQLPAFRGGVAVAASNSAASVTLSGDADAVGLAKRVLDEEKKFARRLRVDTAYHSHHMEQCSAAYVESLRSCGIRDVAPEASCAWYSSVRPGELVEPNVDYWRDNMVQSVRFAEALGAAQAATDFNLAIELGPHPALQGPAAQTLPAHVPYTGLLRRHADDVEALADALGTVWTRLGPDALDLAAFQRALAPASAPAPSLLTNLPSYPWSHGRIHWHESRKARRMRLRGQAFHELLGAPAPDNNSREQRWTNFLRTPELPWLHGHRLQGQCVFPAAGYVAMAVEAGRLLAAQQAGRSVALLEVRDLVIAKAITLEDDANFAVETLFALTQIGSPATTAQTAEFAVYACPNTQVHGQLDLVASGSVKIVYGEEAFNTLSSDELDDAALTPVDSGSFYSALDALGYGYTGPFRTLTRTKRRLGHASATLSTYSYADDETTPLVVHPATLDVAFQAAFLALSSPGDECLWALHVPTSIGRVRVNPALCAALPAAEPTKLPLRAVLRAPDPREPRAVRCGVDVFADDDVLLQVEDLVLKPFSPATPADDRPMFATTRYAHVALDGGGAAAGVGAPDGEEEEGIAAHCERVAYFYLRKWRAEIADTTCDEPNGAERHLAFRDAVDQLLAAVDNKQYPSVEKEWADDDAAAVEVLTSRYPESVDLKLLSVIDENMPAIVRDDFMQDGLLDQFYGSGLGFAHCNVLLARMMQQITLRYPHVKIVEIGARTGQTTKAILDTVGSAFSSYTCTDVSSSLVEKAAEKLTASSQKLVFRTFAPEETPSSQGFDEHAYDVVVLSSVWHASASLEKILENARRLLRPGGYLIAAVLASNATLHLHAVLGALEPSWWAGVSDSRRRQASRWHTVLRKTGFGGIDTMTTPETDSAARPLSVLAAQAVDERVAFLRKPLAVSSATPPFRLDELVILGGTSLRTARLVEEIAELAAPFCRKVTTLDGLPTADDAVAPMTTFINLVDLDEPLFKGITDETMEGLKCLFELASNVLWVTAGARTTNAYYSASIGFGRTISFEMSHLSLQFLDLGDYDDARSAASRLIADAVLRLAAMNEWDAEGTLSQELLWSKELETYLEDGHIMVPRIISVEDQSDRFNSLRRPVFRDVDPRISTVYISAQAADDAAPTLREEPVPLALGRKTAVQVSHSILSALSVTSQAFLFLEIGTSQGTGDTLVVLTERNASKAIPSISVRTEVAVNQRPRLLAAVASELLAASLLSRIPPAGHILLHEPGQDELLISALATRAAVKSIRVTFSSTNRQNTNNPAWIQLSPWSSAHVLERSIPAGLTHYLDLTAHGNEQAKDVGNRIRDHLPASCMEIKVSDLFRHDSVLPPSSSDDGAVFTAFQDAVIKAEKKTVLCSTIDKTIRTSQIGDALVSRSPMSVVDWTLDQTLTINVQPIEHKRLFAKDKTYLLVGLSGELGRSITEWMSRNGAGCVCLTSRKPKPDGVWQAQMEKAGTIVKVFAMDITKKLDLQNVVDEIQATCPPIAGVSNGAALFHDAAFSEMSLEMMEKVLKPKIDGTRNLDEVFGDIRLDFFIVFSSLTAAIGNSGQSNYTAGNAYMTGLVGQRRKRGLAGTSLEIGRVAGIGYVERAGDVAREQLIRSGFIAISESDLHQLFAEAVLAGLPDSDASPIVITGCRTAREGDEVRVPWFEDARLSHKVVIEARSEDAKAGGKKSGLPGREQLADATTKQEALEILKDWFAAKLALISRLAEGQTVDHDVPLVELGIDSLVAVEVRGWFLKELKTDVPVLKVLGGGSVAVLCEEVVEKLPENLLPNLGKERPSAPTEEKILKAKDPKSTTPKAEEPKDEYQSDISPRSQTPQLDTPASSISTPIPMEKPRLPELDYVRSELLSYPQSRFWFLRFLINDPTTFNVAFYFRISGNLRVGDLERAVRLVANRHEVFRTCFVADDKEADLAYQKVLPSSAVRLERKKIKHSDDVKVEFEAMKSIPFDLDSGKLIRLVLLTLSPTEHYLVFNYHHILMDGVSFQNFLHDLEKAYQRQPLGPLPCQIPDLSCRQRMAFENGDFAKEITYWRNEFPNGHHPVLPLLPMAQVSSRIPTKAWQVHQVQCDLEPGLKTRIKRATKAHRSTTFHFYLATFKAMLFRFTAAEDLTIGIADANRNDEDVMRTVGLLLNLLTLRFKWEPRQRFDESITEARDKAYGALANSRVPFDVLLKELNVPRSSAYSPFFQAFFDYRQGTNWQQQFGNTQFDLLELSPGRTAYDMTLDITDTPDGARILFRTQASIYDIAAAQLLLNTYVHLLGTFASDTSSQLQDPPLWSDSEAKRALSVGRGPSLKSSWLGGTLPHRIDYIVAENKEKVALKDGHGKALSYGAMRDRIEAIAEALQQQAGVGEGSRVLVFEDATADWPCSMLAIMRLGGVYVPLDLRNPLPRLADVARSCKPTAILVDSTTSDDAPQVNVSSAAVVNVSHVGTKPSACVPNSARPDSVAAILYTSGSTGKPKGIIVKHSGLRNEIEGYTTQWGLRAEKVLQQSTFTFNHSSDQMYTGLVNGGSVYIVPWSKRGDPIEVTKIIQEESITYTKATPAEYSLWLEYGLENLQQASSWRFAFGGGESLSITLPQALVTLNLPKLRFFNSYGPTEISISSTKMEIAYREPQQGRIPCGYSLPNYVAYILDDRQKPVPVGMPGELWIGGAGVSLGYLDNQKLTDQHFVPDPYATPDYIAQGWTKMYRTGDIAHLQDDGAMVFHHRMAGDTQVKIRGLRIELGDIESNIVQSAGGALKEAVVTLRDGDPPLLVAHVVFARTVPDAQMFLRNLLQGLQVPQYMVPVMAIPLDRMPLSNHAKVDRKALKALPLPQSPASEVPNDDEKLSETMVQLRHVWEKVLNAKHLGLDITPSTDFFTIGGNSLLAVRLQSRIRHMFNTTLRLVDLLTNSTLKEMAERIERSTTIDLIDWDKETALPDEPSLAQSVNNSASIKTTDKVLLITGAGGFLGKHILTQLVARPDIAKIHCIGLRDKPAGTRRHLAVSSPKIITHHGDLSSPWLGLSEATFAELAADVDAILHMAAVRSFWDNYHVLRPSNVAPTKALVRLAAARRISLHYVSTAGVLPASTAEDSANDVDADVDADADSAPGSVAAYPAPPVDGSNGYVASRWASERVLERAAKQLKLPVTVHRFVPPGREAATGDSDRDTAAKVTEVLDHFAELVDGLGVMPLFEGVRGHFEMMRVGDAAGALVGALVGEVERGVEEASGPVFRHHRCDVKIELAEMEQVLQEKRGKEGLSGVPVLGWVGRAKRGGLEWFVSSQEVWMVEKGEWLLARR